MNGAPPVLVFMRGGLFGLVGEFVGELDVGSGTGHGSDYEEDSEEDEWDAEPLAHVEGHVLFELYLRVFDEFD